MELMASTVLKTVNERGIPSLSVVGIESDGTNTTFSFEPHRFVRNNFSGFFVIRISQTVTSSDEPVFFTTQGLTGTTTPVTTPDGAQATVAAFTSTAAPTFHLMFYDRESNKLQLID